MNQKLFTSIFNLLETFGQTMLSNSKKSINCFTFVDNTSSIDALLPSGWTCKANRAQFNPDGSQKSPEMTTVFCAKTQTADEAFADFQFAQ